jgi:hypothetical protein
MITLPIGLSIFSNRRFLLSPHTVLSLRPVRRGVFKGVDDGCRPPALQAGHPRNSHEAVSGVAHLQGVEGLSMVGLGETLGSPWIPLARRACFYFASLFLPFIPAYHTVIQN